MYCTIDKFKNEFPTLNREENNISSLSDPEFNKIVQWTNTVNTQAREQGFDKELFRVEYKELPAITGHANHRSNNRKIKILHVNTENINEYDSFVEDELLVQLHEMQFLDESITEEIEDANIISEEALQAQEDRIDYQYGDVLFSPVTYDSSDDSEITDNPVTFREWKETRINLLKSLEKNKNRLLRDKGKKEKLLEINKLIKQIETEIANFDDTDPNYVHEKVISEIHSLNSVLDLSESNPVQIANILDNNRIRERIDDLQQAFYHNKVGEAYINFHKGLDDSKLKGIKADITDLDNKYKDALEKLIINIVKNNELVLQYKEQFKQEGKEQEFEKFIKRVEDLVDVSNNNFKIDGDNLLGKNFLGAGSYDSLLADIVLVTRNINKNKEAGVTNLWRKQLKDSYDKIKFVKNGDEFFTDKLFQKDEFGIKTQKLINPFTQDFYSKFKLLKSAKTTFYRSKLIDKGSAYRDWMTLNKMNVDYIQPQKIKSFVEKYKDNPDFKEFFKYSEVEMEAYEKEMRLKLGNITFELELERQNETVSNYFNDEFLNTNDKYDNNPLRYLENFYSENFDKYDKTTGRFALPNYLRYIPSLNQKSFYNQNFKDVENLNVNGFKDFYISAKNILDYTRETARTEGIDVNFNDIISLRDSSSREAKKNLSSFGGVWLDIKSIAKNLFSELYEGNLENPDNDINYTPQFNSKYFNYGHRQINTMTEILARGDYDNLKNIARKEGLTIPPKYEENTVYNRSKLAISVATNRVNKSVSLDLHQRISYGASIAESINTRRSTQSIIRLVQGYAKEYKVKNLQNYMEVWNLQNILEVGYLNIGKIGRIERYKLTSPITPKYLTEAEKELKKLLLKEKNNINEKYNFIKDGSRYYTEQGRFYKEDILAKTVNEIKNKIEIKKQYESYIKDEIDALGKDMRVGTLTSGLLSNMYTFYLSFALPAGFKNRMAGYNQNNEMAASGLHGFNMDDLNEARKLLSGHNIKKTLNYSGLPKFIGIQNTHKTEQIDILLHLAESLGLLNNIREEAGAGDGSFSAGQTLYKQMKVFSSDFAMNNPEFHNQMEPLVSMMINIQIPKADGTMGRLYDPKTRSFPYDPKTMKLLPEYITENNIKNWEEFEADEEGKAPQNLLTLQYKARKNKTQGNYEVDDKIGIQSTMTGKASTAFMKWAYENLANQYGGKKIDLATAQIDIKGRKIPLFTRFPVLATHVLIQNVGIGGTVAGAITLVGGNPIFLVGLGLVNASLLGTFIYKNRKNISMSVDDLGTTISYVTEVLLRSLKTTTLTTTRGLINPISEKNIDKYSGRSFFKNRNLSARDRLLLSESAQEIADKINMSIQFLIIGMVLKSLYILATASSGDDEEDKMKKLEVIEGNLKFLTNIKNQITVDSEKYTSPSMLWDTYNQIVFLNYVKNIKKDIFESISRCEDGKISEEERNFNIARGVLGSLTGTPKSIITLFKPSSKTNSGMFSDDRIYDSNSTSWIDDYLLNSHLTGEAKFEPLVTKERDKVKLKLESIYRKKLRDEFDKEGRSDYENMDDIVKQNVKSHLEDSDAYIGKNRNNEDIYKNTDWNAILKSAEKDEVTTTLKEKGSGGSKSTKGSRSKSSRGKRKGSDD